MIKFIDINYLQTKVYMKKLFFLFFVFILVSKSFPQDSLFITKDYIPHTDTTLIFSPSDYDSTTKYPLVVMLHGWAGNYNQWNEDADLQGFADKYKFVIVCPDGFYDSWYIDSPVKKNSQYEKFFFNDLMPHVFTNYKIDKSNIFITGLSMGGHGAMYLMLTHPDFFKSAGSTSGIMDLTPFPDKYGLDKVLGSFNTSAVNWLKHSDFYLLKNIKHSHRKIIVDCGTEDFSFSINKKFVDFCKYYNVDVTFISGPGNHSHKYWRAAIPKHFEFFNNLVKEK